MAKTNKIKHLDADFTISQGKQTWIFTKSVDYDSAVFAITEYYTADTRIVIQGRVTGQDAILSYGSNVDITLEATAAISGSARAIETDGVSARIENHGTITGTAGGQGINMYGLGSEVYNSGTIISDSNTWGIYTPADAVKIVNEKGGRIESGIAVYLNQAAGKTATLINEGKIISDGSHAVGGGNGVQHIVNRGRIEGIIGLADGADRVDTRGGKLTEHNVFAGAGDDMLITDNASYGLWESAGEGFDTVKSTVSYVLNSYSEVEKLVLIGKANINATGVERGEEIVGNSGRNRIDGAGGSDDITGGKGNDRLTGGTGADNFTFKTGDGRDVITDFNPTEDHVYFDHWNGLKNYHQLLAHSDFKNGDMTITAGHDRLVLHGIAADGNIDSSMFVFIV